ncbi:hypothetical protein [Marinomonas epiphytica]
MLIITKTHRFIWIISFCGLSFSTYLQADLIHFGHQCLADERQLTKQLQQLEEKEAVQRQKDLQLVNQQQDLNTINTEIEALEIDLEDCQQQGNNAHCYQIRASISRLTALSQELERDIQAEQSLAYDSTGTPLDELTREKFNRTMQQFVSRCRESDQHYALLNSPEAYLAVCINQNAKQTITCTFQ